MPTYTRTERLWQAYGELTRWWLNNRTHPAVDKAVQKCCHIAEMVDQELGSSSKRWNSKE